jgi:hypothetical protein
MIELSDLATAILGRGNQTRFLRISSWYGDQLVADDLPIAGSTATETVDRADSVPERLTLQVPRLVRGVDYTPIGVDHPLAANGQRLKAELGIQVGIRDDGTPNVEYLQRRWFVIYESQPTGDVISVEARGLLWPIQEARLVSPYQPTGTFKSAIRGLIEPALTVAFDTALADRAVPTGINYDDDRLGAVQALLAAWPAEGHVTADGYYQVAPAADTAAVSLALTDGTGGTVITASGDSSRDGVYNAVVARGTTADGGVVQGVSYDTTSPAGIGKPFNDLPVPFFFDSPLLTTQAQAQAASATRLATLMRRSAETYDVTMVPHIGLQEGDRVTLTTDHFTARPGIVEALTLPYQAGGGAQNLTVRSLA